jgi:acyl-CoA reductase-like NAD-dependent aldehyde dehydrogenase
MLNEVRLIAALEIHHKNFILVGDPLEQDTFLGPMISENEAKRVEKWVKDAAASGAKVLVGGKREGSFYGNFDI